MDGINRKTNGTNTSKEAISTLSLLKKNRTEDNFTRSIKIHRYKMKRLIPLIILLVFNSCSSLFPPIERTNKIQTTVFKSIGNGIADITLTLKSNNTFYFKMKILSDSELHHKKNIISSSGKWAKQGNKTVLVFANRKIDLSQLALNNHQQMHIVNKHTLEINSLNNQVRLWGITCVKQK